MIRERKVYWELPKTKPDIEVPFNFKTYRLIYEGLYFIGLNLAIPLIVLLITSFTLNRSSTTFSIVNLATSLGCLAVSFLYAYWRSPKKLVRSGLLIFYLFVLIPVIAVFVFSLILSVLKAESQWITIAQFWIQIISEIVVIAFAFHLTTGLKKRIYLTFKFAWKWLLIIFVIGVFLMWGTSELYFLIFKNTPLSGNSNNQNSLTDILHHPESQAIKIFYIITLFVFTVCVAPLAEELAFRHAWFIGSGNRWVGFATAAIYFGYLHVQTGDVEHILTYVISGLILAGAFNVSRGNVTYSWLVHLGSNLLVFILLLV